ncbi:hypothetical protein Slala03_75600 [Streptomyces lavendulae subsp. lavendulae]|nr:hypothetical protein Slala03_75600 [Streptomyces lavendulae subsp. lavendulae]
MWESAALSHRAIAVLPPPLKAYADRLVLQVEHSWEDLSDVDAASFRLGGCFLILSQFTDAAHYGVTVWLDRRHTDEKAALAALLHAVGIPAHCARGKEYSSHPAAHYEAASTPVPTPAPEPLLARILRTVTRAKDSE